MKLQQQARKEMKNLVSINAAAILLERDRATLVRALRYVPPDGHERGQPRWRMATIVDALTIKPQARHKTGKYRDRYRLGRSKALDGMLCVFEKQLNLITVEKSVSARRDMALALAPLLNEYQATYLEIGRTLRVVDDDVLDARADLIWQEMMEEVSAAAECNNNDFWMIMCGTVPSQVE